MQQNKILYWLKELLFWNHSDIMKKRILKDIEKQRGNKHQEFGWFIALLDENDFSNGFRGKINHFFAKIFHNRLTFIANKNKKELTIINCFPRTKLFVMGDRVEITLPLHSGIYLPEIPVPDTEYEKYKEMQQNLQQAIELETGLKFDTQQFLLQYKEKLGI
ncbi:MAG: hypothetical protein IJ187_00645 [Neisseriaceae bacterium]|nr:hypothetical protein [Neisseriaceae bacterium]